LYGRGECYILEEFAEGFVASFQQVEFGSHSWGEASRGSKRIIQNQPNSLMGFSGFWRRSLGLKAYKFMDVLVHFPSI